MNTNRWFRIILGILAIAILATHFLWVYLEGEGDLSPKLGNGTKQTPIQGDDPAPLGTDKPTVPRSTSTIPKVKPRIDQALIYGMVNTPNNPAAGARVEWLILSPTGMEAVVYTASKANPDGGFFLLTPPQRAGILRIRYDDYPPLIRRNLLTPGPGTMQDLGTFTVNPGARLRIMILDQREGLAVKNARITLVRPPKLHLLGESPIRGKTDFSGVATLTAIPFGGWRLQVSAPGLSPYSAPLALTEEQPQESRTIYLPVGPGLEGTVTNSNGTFQAGAVITLAPLLSGADDHRGKGLTRSDENGRFRFPGLEEGKWSLSARAPGRATTKPRIVNCPTDQQILLLLSPLPRISGVVIAPSGHRLQNADVCLATAQQQGSHWIVSGAAPMTPVGPKGIFNLTLKLYPGAGPWVVVARAKGLLPTASAPFHLQAEGRKREISIPMTRGGEIRGQILPAKAARATIFGVQDLPCPPFLPLQPPVIGKADSQGLFSLAPVVPGKCVLLLRAADCVDKKLTILVTMGKSQTMPPVTLASGVIASGVLLGPTGLPEPGGLVCLQKTAASDPIKVTAGPEGRFSFPPVKPGRYIIKACRQNAGPFVALADFKASERQVVLDGQKVELNQPIRIGGQ